jgi:hypothetical protein
MESTDTAELDDRERFFNKDLIEIRETLLEAVVKLSQGRIESVLINDIDKHLFGPKTPDTEKLMDTTQLPDERYLGHYRYLDQKGYVKLSTIKVYPTADGIDKVLKKEAL